MIHNKYYGTIGIDSFNITLKGKIANDFYTFIYQCIKDKIISSIDKEKNTLVFEDGNCIEMQDVPQCGLKRDVNTIFNIKGILGYEFASKPQWDFIKALTLRYGKELNISRIDYCIDFKMQDYNKLMGKEDFSLSFMEPLLLGRIKLSKPTNNEKYNTEYTIADDKYLKVYWYNKHIKDAKVRTVNTVIRVEVSLKRSYLARSVINCGTMIDFIQNYENLTKEILPKLQANIMGDEVSFDTELTNKKIKELVHYMQGDSPYPPYMARNDENNIKNTKFIKNVIELSYKREYLTKTTHRPNVKKISLALNENKNKVGNVIQFLELTETMT